MMIKNLRIELKLWWAQEMKEMNEMIFTSLSSKEVFISLD